jgi:ElaB/YqjD/DUF883 family membrane-anchored ribosome-binding protein
MEEARRVLDRLEQIEALRQRSATPTELLAEVRALLAESEVWLRSEGHAAGAQDALERVRKALESGRRTLVA